MWLSNISIKKPVFITVIHLLIVIFSLIAFKQLPLREYPDIDPPIISIDTSYQGASATVIENKITKIIEDKISNIEGISNIESQSLDGSSFITVEFEINTNIDIAAANIRDKISGILARLPKEIDPPEVSKASSGDNIIMWLDFTAKGMEITDTTEYAKSYVANSFSTLEGVARVRMGGALYKSLRVWIDSQKLAEKHLVIQDIQEALINNNTELPAGAIESENMYFTLKVLKSYKTVSDFKNLPISTTSNGYVVRLSDVARVEIAPEESRSSYKSNGVPSVAIGIIKQSKANVLDVTKKVKDEMAKLNANFPDNISLKVSYDSSAFVKDSIDEVYITLAIAIVLVMVTMFIFLGDIRAIIIPTISIPISLVGSFMVLYALGYSINILTLLALVLATGLVVDDAIVVVENIHHRIVKYKEAPILAARRGTEQVGFAVIATTVVLIVVFLPLLFLKGQLGRLFGEFSVTIATTIALSGFVSLTITPMLAAKLLKSEPKNYSFIRVIDAKFESLKHWYTSILIEVVQCSPKRVLMALIILAGAIIMLVKIIPSEFTPQQDRRAFTVLIKGPQGASYSYMLEYVNEIEKRLLPYVEDEIFQRFLIRVPGNFSSSAFNNAKGSIVLNNNCRDLKPITFYMRAIKKVCSDLTGVKVATILSQPFGEMDSKPVQFVLGGPSFEVLAKWQKIILNKARNNLNLIDFESDYSSSKPYLGIEINKEIAAVHDVKINELNETLAILLGSKKVTSFEHNGTEYDIILESEKSLKSNPNDINNIYVKSHLNNSLVPLSELVSFKDFVGPNQLNHYNKTRSITFEANLANGYHIDEALNYLKGLVRQELPAVAKIDYKGESLEYIKSAGSIYYIFALSILIIFLVLSAQFESFVYPFIIMFTVPLAIFGALVSLWIAGQTLNIYSQIALIILIGIATKNGILIVEFANQLIDKGFARDQAIIEAASSRLRPIIMTTFTAAVGALPLVLASGAGKESRVAIGIVIFWGIIISTIFTIYFIPALYIMVTKNLKFSPPIIK